MKKTSLRQNIKSEDRAWFIIDANGLTLGRLSTELAKIISGKNRVDFTPHVDGGDYVVVLNAEKIALTGRKETDKLYYSHSGYLGNLKTTSLDKVRAKTPCKIIEDAVSGMLPKNKLRKDRMKRLRLIIGEKNTYEAQKPVNIKL